MFKITVALKKFWVSKHTRIEDDLSWPGLSQSRPLRDCND